MKAFLLALALPLAVAAAPLPVSGVLSTATPAQSSAATSSIVVAPGRTVQVQSNVPHMIVPGTSYTTPSATNGQAAMCAAGNSAYPQQWTWAGKTSAQPRAATAADNLVPRIDQVRNGTVIASYRSFASNTTTCNGNLALNAATKPSVLPLAASAGCGPFGNASHVDLYRYWLPGDMFKVYPAVYSGSTNNIFLGPKPDFYHDPVNHSPVNITIVGQTVNGIRPVILDASPTSGDFASNQAPIYIWNGASLTNGLQGGVPIPPTGHNATGITIQNIDLAVDTKIPGFSGKGGIYINGGTNVTLRAMRIHGFEMIAGNQYGVNGIINTPNDTGLLLLDQLELYQNGGADGPAHNLYINTSTVDPNYTVHMNNSWSHDAHFGHTFKSRAQNNILTGNYFQGGLPQTALGYTQAENYLVDIPNGGNLTMRNNLLVKSISGPNSNGASVTFDVEGLKTDESPVPRHYSADIQFNTFVTFGSTYNGSNPSWPFFFYNEIAPGAPGFGVPSLPVGTTVVPTVTVAKNLFVGYCNQTHGTYLFMNYRGDQYATAAFGDLSQTFGLGVPMLTTDLSNVGAPAYLQPAMSGRARLPFSDGTTTYGGIGAFDN